jgi:hypothetical protein
MKKFKVQLFLDVEADDLEAAEDLLREAIDKIATGS